MSGRLRTLRPIFGREREVGHAVDRLRSAAGNPVVLVSGCAGIGKTRFLTSVIDALGDTARPVITIDLGHADHHLPYGALRTLVRHRSVEQIATLVPIPPPVLAVTGGNSADELPEPHEVVYAFIDWFERLPVAPLVVVDDSQWIDPLSGLAITTALRSVTSRWLIARREDESSELDAERLVPPDRLTTLELSPLSTGDIGRLAASVSGNDWSPADAHRLAAESGGIPLYAVELARLYPTGLPSGPHRLPPNLHAIFAPRIEQLAPDEFEVVAAAALSPGPSVGLLTLAFPDRDIEPALDTAESLNLVQVEDGPIEFEHPLVIEAVQDRLTGMHRARLHKRLAELAQNADVFVYHLAHATLRPDEQVAAELEAGAERHASRGDTAGAAHLWRRAADLTPRPSPAHSIRTLSAGLACATAGDWPTAHRLLEPSLTSATSAVPDPLRTAARSTLVLVTERRFGPAAAEEVARHSVDLASDERTACQFTRMLVRLRLVHDVVAGRSLADDLLPPFETSEDALVAVGAQAARASARYLAGEVVEIGGLVEHALALELDPAPQGALWHVAELAMWDDRYDDARRVCDQLLTVQPGVMLRSNLLGNLVRVERRSGNWAKAWELIDEIDRQSVVNGEVAAIYDTRDIVWLAAASGEHHLASARSTRILEAADDAPPVATIEWFALAGFAALAAGEIETAVEYLGRANTTAASVGFSDTRAVGFEGDLVEALVLAGDVDRAAPIQHRLAAAAAMTGSPIVELEAARAAVLIDSSKRSTTSAVARLVALLDADDVDDRVGRPFEIGRAWLTVGIAIGRTRARVSARRALDRAHAYMNALGAQPWLDRIEAERQSLGDRRGNGQPGELSGAERRVVDLVCRARSNRQIADELLVSVRTVESHLTSAYRKLGVSSRAELITRQLNGEAT